MYKLTGTYLFGFGGKYFHLSDYILDVYKRQLDRLIEVGHPFKVILMDRGPDSY